MPISEIAICNLGLARAGIRDFITSLDDVSLAAQVSKIFYPIIRDYVLEAAAWPFANRRQLMVALGGPAYSATTTYTQGDTVQFLNLVYVSLKISNLGNQPDQSPSF